MPRPRSDIDKRIIAAARVRFLNEGVDGASLRKIAQDAGTSLGVIYYYFPTKDDLFRGVVEDVYGRLLEDLTATLSPERPVVERLRGVFDRIARFNEVEFDVVRIILREALVSSERLTQLIQRFSQGHVPMVLATMREGLATGVLDPSFSLPSLLGAVASLAFMPQIARQRFAAASGPLAAALPSADELADTMFRVLMGGVARA